MPAEHAPGRRRSGFLRPPPVEALRALPPADLVTACRAHRDGAWEELLLRYANLIYSTAVKAGLNEEEQEEAFGATVAAVYGRLEDLREPDQLLTWIIGIARRQAVNCIRARSRAARLDGALDLDEAPGPDASADDERLRLEQAQHALEALSALSERCRRLVEMLFYEDPPPDYGTIARREGIPIGSIGPTRGRCLERMRRYLEERGWA